MKNFLIIHQKALADTARITKRRIHRFRHLRLMFLLTTGILACWCPVAFAAWGATVPNPIMEYHYSYDNNGNITKIEDKVNGTGYNQSFTYDEVDRLSSAIGPYGNQNYTYDSVGNNTDSGINPNTDNNGNAIFYNNKTIEYDYENRPTKITDTVKNTITEFAYDYSGQRVYTKVNSGTITSEDYYVGNIYEEKYYVDSSSPTISASTTTVTNIYAGSIRVAGLTTQTTATGTENNTLYYHGDHLGSSSIITDGSGTVVRDISYQPWGNVQSNTEESGATTLDPSHKFTGQILDDSTDLYYYGARYYDPTLRRFITPDTIVQSPYDPQSLNRYAYCRNNPLIYVDPSGHWRLDNFLVSSLQVASYASMFAGGWGMPIAIASSMAQTGLQGGHLDDAIQAGAIGGVSSLIGQGVALGIGPAGIGEGFGRTMAAGAGAGFASGGIGAIMSGQSGSAVWQSAFQGAAMGAATSGVMWGITQGNSDIALYRETVNSYRQAIAAVRSLNISEYQMYVAAGDWWDIPENYKRAVEIAQDLLFKHQGHNNPDDAMRHAEWSKMMASELGSGYSWLFGVGHEITGLLKGQPWGEFIMDLHNNAVGRAAAREGILINPNRLQIDPMKPKKIGLFY